MALRHALVFVALLPCVDAHEASACREWFLSKWQHDEDCCAGEKQAACKPGYRYVKLGKCHREADCVFHSYECELCNYDNTTMRYEACDSNYDIETEDGEDYDCGTPVTACYFLWPIAWVFLYLAIQEVKKLIADGKQPEAKELWGKRKKIAWGIFWFCVVMHYLAIIWMGQTMVWIFITTPCVVLGCFIPLACCKHGDTLVSLPQGREIEAPTISTVGPGLATTAGIPYGKYDESTVVAGTVVTGTVVSEEQVYVAEGESEEQVYVAEGESEEQVYVTEGES